jgi:hypothetical protein
VPRTVDEQDLHAVPVDAGEIPRVEPEKRNPRCLEHAVNVVVLAVDRDDLGRLDRRELGLVLGPLLAELLAVSPPRGPVGTSHPIFFFLLV